MPELSQMDRKSHVARSSLIIATCRADPANPDVHAHIPLPAGQYQVLRIDRREVQGEQTPCDCYACPDGTYFAVRNHADIPCDAPIVLVVHGFNCTEASGIMTAFNIRDALLAWGVPIAGDDGPRADEVVVVGFTWPCEHSLFPGYLADKEGVARFAAFSLANLLTDLRRANPKRPLILIAHSMGCFLTLKALNMLAVLRPTMSATEAAANARDLLDLVIWLAPDINASALERSTPASPQLRFWQHPGQRSTLRHLMNILHRPRTPIQEERIAVKAPDVPDQHPLDGYGYAALNLVRHLAIYTSLNDEALWVSPWANHATEESGGAEGSIRLGWCGPLHPDRMLVPDPAAGNIARDITLLDCTPIVFEHGDYFYIEATQQAMASQVGAILQHPVATPDTLMSIPAWHAGSPLQYPPDGESLPPGLHCYTFATPQADHGTPAPHQSGHVPPTRTPAQTPLAWLWHSPLAPLVRQIVRFWAWWYRV